MNKALVFLVFCLVAYGVTSTRFAAHHVSALRAEIETTTARIDVLEDALESERYAMVRLSGYSSRVRETDSTPYVTACQTRVGPGTVAVSRSLFERGWTFGRKVYVYQHGVFEVNDLMSSRIDGDAMDIWFGSTREALRHGVKEDVMACLIN